MWPPTPSLSGRLHVHEPSLSFTDLTPRTCLALLKVRSEISASRALFLIALAVTGVWASSEVRSSFASVSADFSSSSSGTLRSCAAVALRGRRFRESLVCDPGGPVLSRLYLVG